MLNLARIREKIAAAMDAGGFADVESETLEVKPVPSEGGAWTECYKTINAFLNTRGGLLLLGLRETGSGSGRRWEFTGWKEHAEPKLKEMASLFTDSEGRKVDVSDCLSQLQLVNFRDGKLAAVTVDELPADRKYVLYKGAAYKRIFTGDHRISDLELQRQQEFQREAELARELQPIEGLSFEDLDLDKLNQFIFQLNQPTQVEAIKSNLQQAHSFLERKRFMKDCKVTVLGALVCAKNPGDCLGFRCHAHCYVDLSSQGTAQDQQIARDKQDLIDNVLQLMEQSHGYLLRHIQVGVSAREGGTSSPEYPATLLREIVNNALAHRDYAIDRQVIVSIRPNSHLTIQNPGKFRQSKLLEVKDGPVPIRRILPEAKPRNPKLADVLRVYRKWEGRGIGMATLVNLCLGNEIDLPYYRLRTDEVSLVVPAGQLLDQGMETLLDSFAAYLEERVGQPLTREQKLVLAYLIKSQWANEQVRYTILLTPDNNHFAVLAGLEKAGLIGIHAKSMPNYPIYTVDRVLLQREFREELQALFGPGIADIDSFDRHILSRIYMFEQFSKVKAASAKRTSFALWYEQGEDPGDIRGFDAFYRKIRKEFNKLAKAGYIERLEGGKGYSLRKDFQQRPLL